MKDYAGMLRKIREENDGENYIDWYKRNNPSQQETEKPTYAESIISKSIQPEPKKETSYFDQIMKSIGNTANSVKSFATDRFNDAKNIATDIIKSPNKLETIKDLAPSAIGMVNPQLGSSLRLLDASQKVVNTDAGKAVFERPANALRTGVKAVRESGQAGAGILTPFTPTFLGGVYRGATGQEHTTGLDAMVDKERSDQIRKIPIAGKVAEFGADLATDPWMYALGPLEKGISGAATKANKALKSSMGVFDELAATTGKLDTNKINKSVVDAAKESILSRNKPITATSLEGKFTTPLTKQNAIAKAENEYNDAIETIQNHFKTNELRSIEFPLIKSELGIDINKLVENIDKAKGYKVPGAGNMSMKRSAGLATQAQENVMENVRVNNMYNPKSKLPLSPQDNISNALNSIEKLGELPKDLKPIEGLKTFKSGADTIKPLPVSRETAQRIIDSPLQNNPALVARAKAVLQNKNMPENINNPTEFIQGKISEKYDINKPLNESGIKNTVRTSEWSQAPDVQKVIKDMDATYNVKTDKDTIEIVGKMLNDDYKGTLDRITKNGISNKEDVVAAGQIARDMVKNGDIDSMHNLVKKSVRPEATNAGQMIQGFTTWKPDSLEGAVFKADKLAKEYENIFKNTRPEEYSRIMESINQESKNIAKLLQESTNGIKINIQLFAEKLKQQSKLPKDYVKKIIDLASKTDKNGNLKYDIDDITDIIKERYKIPSLSKSDTRQMFKYWTEAQKHAPESYEYRKAMYEMGTVIPNKIPPELGDKLIAIQALNLFGNTKTLSKIFFGNIASTSVKNAKEALLEVPLDKLASFVTNKRTTVSPNLLTQGKGMARRAKEVIKDLKNDVDTSVFNDSFDYRQTNPFKKGSLLRKVSNTSRAGFGLVENTFKQGIFDDSLRQQIKVANMNATNAAKKAGKPMPELITNPTDEMRAIAKNKAEKLMLADDNLLTNKLYGLRRGINEITNTPLDLVRQAQGKGMIDKGKFGAGNLLLPVLKTPANMAIWTAEHLPINHKMITGVVKSLKGKEGQKEIVEGIANGLVGTAIGAVGYQMGKNGLANASPDKDADARAYSTENGKQPYSINIGGKNITIDWLQPFASHFNFGSELGQGQKNSKPVSAALNSFLEQSFMQSINNVMGGGNKYNDKAENFQNALLNTSTQFVPMGGLVNQISKSMDGVKRETDNNPLKKVAARTPFRFMLDPKTDNSGNNIKEDNLFDTWVSPSITKYIKKSPLIDEMSRLYKDSGEVKQFIPKVKDNKTIKGNQIPIEKEALQKIQKDLSSRLTTKFSQTIENSKYKRSENDEEKAKILSSIIEQEKKKLVDAYIKSKGINLKTGKPR